MHGWPRRYTLGLQTGLVCACAGSMVKGAGSAAWGPYVGANLGQVYSSAGPSIGCQISDQPSVA